MTVIDRTDTTGIAITPRSPTICADISGAHLGDDLSDKAIGVIRQALLDHKVVFFRDQDITTEQHLDFARRFGDLEIHPFTVNDPDRPEVLRITHDADHPGRENNWHSDVTWRLQPSLGSVLRCIESPELGGDTLFADMYAAYDGLPQRIKERVEGRVARHDFPHFRTGLRKRGATEAEIEALQEQYPNPEHPVIRTHPETGRKGICVNSAFTQQIVGMDPDESAELLQLLYDQAEFPEYQVRFSWEEKLDRVLGQPLVPARRRFGLLAAHPPGRARHDRRGHAVLRPRPGSDRCPRAPVPGPPGRLGEQLTPNDDQSADGDTWWAR